MAKKNIDAIQEELINNPNLNSEQVDVISKLINNSYYNMDSVKYLMYYDADQLKVIELAAKEFNNDVEKMKYIMGIIDIDSINITELNATQMYLRFIAIKNGIDTDIIDKIIDASIPYACSKYVLDAYLDGYDLTDYIHYNPAQLYEIYSGAIDGINYKEYSDQDIDAKTMGLIRHAMTLGFTCDYDYDTGDIALFKLKK